VKFRVRFAETDQMGIAHHSAYVVWFEAGRVEWLRERGLSYRAIEEAGVSLAVSELQVRYRQAAYFDDELELHTELHEAKSRRFRFGYRLTRPSDGALLAAAQTVHTPVDRQGRAIRMPEAWLHALLAFVVAA
jgi:acyl-CoA thioester hydrolase